MKEFFTAAGFLFLFFAIGFFVGQESSEVANRLKIKALSEQLHSERASFLRILNLPEVVWFSDPHTAVSAPEQSE